MLADINDGGVSPPDPNRLNDPNHLRERAAQALAIAAKMGDPEATEGMRRVAADYEKMARKAEQRRRGG
jgi:hypothetical protein